jgi:flagellar biosynthesis/type III secretory pathway protein FliH
MTMSSCEFSPIWTTRENGDLTTLPLTEIAGEKEENRSSYATHHLQEFGEAPVPEIAVAETVIDVTQQEVQSAYERGFSKGREQGIAEGYEKMLPALETLNGLTEALEQTHADFRLDLERGLHALAIAVARQLIQREVTADPSIISDLIERALELVPHDLTLEVRLNPTDLEVLQTKLDQMKIAGRPLNVQWLEDASLDRGSFLLETPLRVVDGRTDDALRALYERLSHD